MANRNKPTVVFVEDDETDTILFMRYAKRNGAEDLITCFDNGDEALDHLRAQRTFSSAACKIVITDINMPEMSGHELIDSIRSDQNIENTVIFVLSSSDFENDRLRAYKNKVAGYIVKDSRGVAFEQTAQMLKAYCEAVTL